MRLIQDPSRLTFKVARFITACNILNDDVLGLQRSLFATQDTVKRLARLGVQLDELTAMSEHGGRA